MEAATDVIQQPEHHPHHTKRWVILGFLGLAQLMVVLDATIVNVALYSMQKSLHFSNVDQQWLITAYSLAFGSLLLLGGRLSDLLGRKTALQIGLAGFALASALGGAAQSFEMLVVARAIQGAFGAVLAPAALAMLTTTFVDRDERAKAFSIFGSIAGAGAALGLLLGGFLTQYFDWRWTLYVNLIFAGIALVGTQALLVRERAEGHGGLDIVSTLLISLGLFSIVYSLSEAATKATTDYQNHETVTLATAFMNPTTIGFMVAGIVLVTAFVVRQLRIDRPMLPMGILLDRLRGGALAAILLASVAMFAVFLFLNLYLQKVKHYTPMGSGLAFLPMVVMIATSATISQNKILPRTGPRPLVPFGMVLGACGMFTFTHLSATGSYWTEVFPGLILTGLAMGVVFATTMNTATARVRHEDAGAASATVNVFQQIGGSIGTALLSTVAIAASLAFVPPAGTGPRQASYDTLIYGYTTAFWWAVVIFLVAAVVTGLVLPSGRPQPADEVHQAVVH
jgi:EmrB/QacA subfamily drug resistance transporter